MSTARSQTDRLERGDQAPDFTLETDTGEQVTLGDLRGRKVIVYFYPAAMTPGCTKQACDFTDSLDSLRPSPSSHVTRSASRPFMAAHVESATTATPPFSHVGFWCPSIVTTRLTPGTASAADESTIAGRPP